MADFPRTRAGRYQTEGLSPQDFNRVFDQIQKDQRKKRRRARSTITPFLLKNKSLDDIVKLGRRKGGMYFTTDDLKGFEKKRNNARSTYTNSKAGITYAQLISHSQQIDIKRANNKVDNGLGITSATPVSIKHNLLIVRVKASQASHDQFHRVKIRFEQWDALLDELTDDKRKNQAIVRQLCAGRLSFDCDCGRHQYWYRYIATAGNFAVAPPKEYAYPKEKNPNLGGVACKHVIHATTRLQSPAWQVRVLQTMLQVAKQVGYGDDRRNTTEHFSDKEQKDLNRNRKSQANVTAMKREWDLYQRRQVALGKKLDDENGSIDDLRKQLTKSKSLTKAQRAKAEKAQRQLQKERDKNALLKQQLADQFHVRKQAFIDALVMTGVSEKEAEAKFMQTVKGGRK
ncbi:phage tail protein [Rosenbergiella collisarenosi]|uniref:phage tail protein n=1 Tax=Rosenbergiella collisarenosi TaxID=1544695 RepID=UPI001F4DE90D|nr:phage tail protein [Rosenbergiella collisarenosi]